MSGVILEYLGAGMQCDGMLRLVSLDGSVLVDLPIRVLPRAAHAAW